MSQAATSPRVALRQRIDAAIDALDSEMEWGRDDCALWCADIIGPVVGYDPAEGIRGTYRSRRGAGRSLGANGLPCYVAGVARDRGWAVIPPAQAEAGDIGIVATPDGPATVIRHSEGRWVARNETGFTVLPDAAVLFAWGVL